MATTPVRCGGADPEGEGNKSHSAGVYKDASGSNSISKLCSTSSSTSRRPKPGTSQQLLQRSTSSSTSTSVNYNRSNSSSQCSKTSSSNSCSTENIKVVVRCRPISAAEQRSSSTSAVHISAETQQVSVLLPATGIHRQQQQQQRSSRVYRFDGVCPVSVQQEELFDTHVKPLIDQVLEGYNCTLFAYGQTGTGKTYTIEGPHDQYAEYLKSSSTSSTSSSSTEAPSTSNSRSSSAAGLPPAAADTAASAGDTRVETTCNKKTSSDSPCCNSSSSNICLSPDAGILPRAVNYIFQQLQQSSSSSDYMVRCSFLEIYNEELIDMLALPGAVAAAPTAASSQQQQQQPPKLRIYEEQVDGNGNSGNSSSWGATKGHGAVRVEGLTEKRVNSPQEVFSLLLGAAPRRSFACSGSNARSSRSHTIFSLSVCITETPKLAAAAAPSEGGTEEKSSNENTPTQRQHATEALAVEEVVRIGKLNLVDLAGSENLEKSWGRGADSARRKEASAINQSLLTLGRCINALVEKNAYIPFRDSKLTRLLQDSLGGSTKTCLIATIGPTADTLEETLCTLDYAFRAKSVTTRPVATLRRSRDALLSQLMSENTQLRLLLQLQREREGVFLPLDTYNEQLLVKSLEKQQQQHADAANAAADSLKRAVADIRLLEQQQTQQRQQQQTAADACAAFAKNVEAQASAGATEQQQLLQQVQKLLQELQGTEEQRAKAAADSATAAAGHQQQHELLQQHLRRHCELLMELQERQTHQRKALLQQLQQVQQEAELTEAAAQHVHQQLQADAAARQQQTEAAAAAVVAAVQQQLASFVEAQRIAAQQQQQLIEEQLACAQRQQQEQQAAQAAAGETANQSAIAATAAADALTTRAIAMVRQVSAATAAAAEQQHKQLSSAKVAETVETITRLKCLRTSCEDTLQRTSSEQEALLQHGEVLLKQHREAESTAHSAAADANAAAVHHAEQQDRFAATAAAALEAAATQTRLCSTCCEKQAAAATEHAATLARGTKHRVRTPFAQQRFFLSVSILPYLQLRRCLRSPQQGGAALDESSDRSKSDVADACSESTDCGSCTSCAAEQAARRWQAWKSLELPPLLTISALREASCTRGELAETHPPLTPDRSPSCSGSAAAAAASQHGSNSNSRKAAGSRLVAAAAAAVTAAATPLQSQRLGRQKNLVGAPVGPSSSKGCLGNNSKQQQCRQETTTAADGRPSLAQFESTQHFLRVPASRPLTQTASAAVKRGSNSRF
ncbi:hypothetical protein Emag_005838 [Eimeria magna]